MSYGIIQMQPMNDFFNAIYLTTDLKYKEMFFKQIDGFAMGSLIFNVIAEVVLEELERNILRKINVNTPFYFRYYMTALQQFQKTNVITS